VTIGAGWVEGAWVDASWVVGAWQATFVADPDPDPTKGGESVSKTQIGKERKLRELAREAAQSSKDELAKLVPTSVVEELARTGKVQVAGLDIDAPKIPAPAIPEHMLREAKLEVLTKAVKQQRLQAERDYEIALKAHQEDLRMFEEEFITFLMLVLL
jgi:hypothetical protein